MHVDLSQEDVEMIVDALNIMAQNITKQQEEPTEYQPYMIDEVEEMIWFLKTLY